ncbi:uncharacterized protein KQ657_004996 [Scheffersomyces spartinae]|uniref:Patatin-like phospholipase domain-containing protein n=1 Tax=Scheffersomyces spartinae TaxID=45513 RepID=A0A9P7VAB2_9ASCO|nr:uncharacterized protein KQ657_004996 [Scheffersomyces spartinae]KAG7194269.1 hypothetical protein KQ657_004996 [Scheffersomyces spartinae]
MSLELIEKPFLFPGSEGYVAGDILRSLYAQYTDLNPPPLTTGHESSYKSTLASLPVIRRFIGRKDEKKERINRLQGDLRQAVTYDQWYSIAMRLDELQNNNSWKLNPQSDLYDYNLIYSSLMDLRNSRTNGDYKMLLYLVRTTWTRNIGNMGNDQLYRHCYVGTKRLIEEYINECQLALDYLVSSKIDLDDHYLLGMLIQTRKNIGRTALVLSGGSTFGIFHIGVLTTLLEANLLPRIISGSSAGSIIASILCCNTNEEVASIVYSITETKFNIFEIQNSSKDSGKFKNVLEHLSHFLKYGTLFDIDGLKETMIAFVGELTFREAYNRTGKILNITVSPTSIHEHTKLLNYLTAPNCLIWSAVCASCSLPGVFPSISIYEKDPRTNETHEWNNDVSMKYVDGSVDGDLPIVRLLEMFNVDHIIAVQVNPHVVPILKVSVSNVGGEIENELRDKGRRLLNNIYDFVTCEMIHYLQILSELDIYKNLSSRVISVLTQKYSGDITILPDFHVSDFLKLFENPTPQFLLDFIIRGARASWPKVTIINNHCRVEFALDKAITALRTRIITSSTNRILYKSYGPTYENSKKPVPISIPNQHKSTPSTPMKPTAPTLSRQNSGLSRHSKRSSMFRSSRKSMTSINSLIHGNENLELNGEKKNENFANEGTLRRSFSSSSRRIRKAKSSGNFNVTFSEHVSHVHPVQFSEPTDYSNNKRIFELDSPKLVTNKMPFEIKEVCQKEPACLPRRSSASLNSSIVGLNRLKYNASRNSSQFNLNDINIDSFSKDLRRKLIMNSKDQPEANSSQSSENSFVFKGDSDAESSPEGVRNSRRPSMDEYELERAIKLNMKDLDDLYGD